jgi:hypothetical protein
MTASARMELPEIPRARAASPSDRSRSSKAKRSASRMVGDFADWAAVAMRTMPAYMLSLSTAVASRAKVEQASQHVVAQAILAGAHDGQAALEAPTGVREIRARRRHDRLGAAEPSECLVPIGAHCVRRGERRARWSDYPRGSIAPRGPARHASSARLRRHAHRHGHRRPRGYSRGDGRRATSTRCCPNAILPTKLRPCQSSRG